MRRALSPPALAFAFAFTLGSVGIASAAPLTLKMELDGDQRSVGIGLGGVTLDAEGLDPNRLQKCVSFLNCVDVPLLYSEVSLTSGPLLEFHVTYEPVTLEPLTTRYAYTSGTFSLDVEWEGSDGVLRKGTFSAPITSSVDDHSGKSSPGLDLLVYESEESGPSFAPTAWADLGFGPGLLSRNLAKHLGVGRQTVGGQFNFEPESIDGDPFDAQRLGILDTPEIYGIGLVPKAVAEPGLAALALLSLAGALVQRRRRGSSKTP